MVSIKTTYFLIFCTFLVSLSFQEANAIRSLGMEKWLREQVPLLASLPRGPVPPSGGSPCTYIPGLPASSAGTCSLNEKHFSGGGADHPPPASPTSAKNDSTS